MTTYSVDRCANQSCRTTIDLDWDAVACPCGAVVTCDGCDEVEACDTCRAAREYGEDARTTPSDVTEDELARLLSGASPEFAEKAAAGHLNQARRVLAAFHVTPRTTAHESAEGTA